MIFFLIKLEYSNRRWCYYDQDDNLQTPLGKRRKPNKRASLRNRFNKRALPGCQPERSHGSASPQAAAMAACGIASAEKTYAAGVVALAETV